MSDYFVDKVTEDLKPLINAWWNEWGMEGMAFDAYPEISMVLFHKNIPIMSWCAFKTDSNVVYLDNFISDPLSDKVIRDEGLDILVQAVVGEAKRQGYKYWSTVSKIDRLVERARKYKMTQYGENYHWFTGEL